MSDWLRSTLATCTQTITLLDPLLVTVVEPGVSSVSVFSNWSRPKKAGCPGEVMIFRRATQGGMVVMELAFTLVEPVMKTKLVPSAARKKAGVLRLLAKSVFESVSEYGPKIFKGPGFPNCG